MLHPINGISFWGPITVFTQFRAPVRLCFFPLLLWSWSWLCLHPLSWLLVKSLCSYNWKFPRLPLLFVVICFLTSWWITLSFLLESFIWACFSSSSLFSFCPKHIQPPVGPGYPLPVGMSTPSLSGTCQVLLPRSVTFSNSTVLGTSSTQETVKKCLKLD